MARGRLHPSWTEFPFKDRPPVVAERARCGNWEADLMSFRKPGQFLLVAHERRSRLALLLRQETRSARAVADNLCALIEAMPPQACHSMTFDNGTEFSKHYLLSRRFGITTWFCDTHSPWQKGGMENEIGRIRRCPAQKNRSRGTVSSPSGRPAATPQRYPQEMPRLPNSQRGILPSLCWIQT